MGMEYYCKSSSAFQLLVIPGKCLQNILKVVVRKLGLTAPILFLCPFFLEVVQ